MRFQDISLARLQQQQVDQHHFKKIKDLVVHMGALQAQDYAMSKLAIGLRVPGSTDEQVAKSLDKVKY